MPAVPAMLHVSHVLQRTLVVSQVVPVSHVAHSTLLVSHVHNSDLVDISDLVLSKSHVVHSSVLVIYSRICKFESCSCQQCRL